MYFEHKPMIDLVRDGILWYVHAVAIYFSSNAIFTHFIFYFAPLSSIIAVTGCFLLLSQVSKSHLLNLNYGSFFVSKTSFFLSVPYYILCLCVEFSASVIG